MAYAHVYIVTNARYGTLYVGVTSDLTRRIAQHKQQCFDGFTKQHGLDRLVWFEEHQSIVEAITREKRLKGWHRSWKVTLIQAMNPGWNDLYASLLD